MTYKRYQYESGMIRDLIKTLVLVATLAANGIFMPTAFCSPPPLQTSATQSSEEIEYGVKAAFIFNFMKFIDWPAEKKAEQDKKQSEKSPMIIGILGNNPFGQSFAPILDKTIQERTIQIVNIESFQEYLRQHGNSQSAVTAYQNKYQQLIQQCDILFICRSEEKTFARVLLITKSHAVLTVSDLPDFAKNGGMIEFVEENKKVRFEINLHAVTQKDIKIRSQLLKLARKIYNDESRG